MNLYISTIVDTNQGNRLQNYALQQTLQKLFPGAKIKTLDSWTYLKTRLFVNLFYRIFPNRRLSCFKRFNKRYISFTAIDKKHCKLLAARKDSLFVIGSDQVWNPSFSITSELDFLPDIPRIKKLSYAASFGVSAINDTLRKRAPLLLDIPYVSVREESAVKLVHQLTGQDAKLTLDPTLLLSKEEWLRVAAKPSFEIPDNYVFKYVLGKDANNKLIDEYAKSHRLAIVDINQPTLPIGPSEFIWLIHHADTVITDSYHASIFSIIFQKRFVALKRLGASSDMSSRFSSLFTSLNIKDHYIEEDNWNLSLPQIQDWKTISIRLNSLQNVSLNWLKTAIDNLKNGIDS